MSIADVASPAAISPGPAGSKRSHINVVLFSGGSGTKSITEALRKHPQISLKILINAYDDGHSTGRLRRFIPGMLGPSDVRKNLNRLMPLREKCQRSLKALSDFRLAVNIPAAAALQILNGIIAASPAGLPPVLAEALPHLSLNQWNQVRGYLTTFLRYYDEQSDAGNRFNFTDCAVGNLLFAGCYLENGRDFNATIPEFAAFHDVERDVLLNVTLGENLFLTAVKENGLLLLNEADIVAAQDPSKIRELFLIDADTCRSCVERAAVEPEAAVLETLERCDIQPKMNPAVASALAEADVIIYGPGTQHSSLFPSYLTIGLAEAIAANHHADKLLVANIHRDFDIQTDDAGDIARAFLHLMSRKGRVSVDWLEVVSHYFVQSSATSTSGDPQYVPFDAATFAFPLRTVQARDWESQEGRHDGAYVVNELQHIVQSRIDIELARVHHMVSIVVPVLNEAASIQEVLKSLSTLDFQPLGLSKEIIVVDGGSTDRTAEIARSVRNVKVFGPAAASGRGAALREGIGRARGNLIVFFPGDNEYRTEDLYSIVRSLAGSNFKAVYGTRATKCTDLSGTLKRIYNNNWRLYLISKYGGMLLSIVTLLLYNRYVSDVLSSVKGFDARLLRSLNLSSNGLDLETEIVAKLSRRQEFMLELPVEYRPRTKSAGKKIGTNDGVTALLALFRYRLKK